MIWYKRLGFMENPFNIKPVYNDKIVGFENIIKEVSTNIITEKVQFILGGYGEGKTALLKGLIKNFGGKKKLIYFSCNRIENNLDLEELLCGRYGLVGRLLKIKAKDMILLLDEAQCLTEEDYRKIVNYKKNGFLKAVVLVGAAFEKQKFETFPLVLINLNSLTDENAVRLIRERIGNVKLLSDDVIKFIFSHSKNNARELLKNCEEVCKYCVENNEYELTKDIVVKVLKLEPPKEKEGIKTTPKSFEQKRYDFKIDLERIKIKEELVKEPQKETKPESIDKKNEPKKEENKKEVYEEELSTSTVTIQDDDTTVKQHPQLIEEFYY